ncbi:MAG: endonuclease/exonuclease/phosphatase family protein [Pyrinomonadaceae bacterium]
MINPNTYPDAAPPPVSLDHNLGKHFRELAQFPSSRVLFGSELYRNLKPEIEQLLGSIAQEDFSPATPVRSPEQRESIKATAWNIERGKCLPQIIRALCEENDLAASDVLLLTELDYGMARTNNQFVAREIASALRMNYVFAPCYLALNKGSGLESEVAGENLQALHGNALLSPHSLLNAHAVALPNGKDKMSGKEKRLGSQRAVIADVLHPAGKFRAVSLHLDAHSTQSHRRRQMKIVLDHLEALRPALPVLVGGDWNTSTYNSRRAVYSIGGFFRRVMMGVSHVIKNHYVYPERWFERGLFSDLERRGYDFRRLNELGAGTLHYDVKDLAANVNMGDWVPQWCFWFINWALKENGGRCSLKLDWFAGKGIESDPAHPPRVVADCSAAREKISDHDPIMLRFFIDGEEGASDRQ